MLSRRQAVGYVSVLAAAFAVAVVAGFTAMGRQVDADAYDWMFRLTPPASWQPESALLTIDEASLAGMGGIRRLRTILAEGLESLEGVPLKAVVLDITLADAGDPSEDARLEAAMCKISNLVLAAEMLPAGQGWQEPLGRFRRCAAAVGHVHAAPDELDGVNRHIPLEKVAGNRRYWALALEAFRLSRGVERIVESPDDLQVGSVVVPARREDARSVLLRYLPPAADSSIPIQHLSIDALRRDPTLREQLRGRTVFVGVTAQSAARDRLMTPFATARPMPGVEIHATAYETLARGGFLRRASESSVLLFAALLAAAAGVTYAFLAGWLAYAAGALLLIVAHAVPFILFARGAVLPYSVPVAAAWLSVAGAASYQYFVVRRQLRRTEAEKSRYQQAVHFVTHEMRTPLTAIQGSSELMSRYSLPEDKRKQIAGLIHTESQRLARMIETFLSVERLSAGQMELKREPFLVRELALACIDRTRPLADPKRILVQTGEIENETLVGDRELMEYAVFNLLTNAVKYSPAGTQVAVSGRRDGVRYRLAVEDQGIGMDEKELRNLFRKFYRTRRAVASGEPGVGIGLSIVEQIITQHGGSVEVSSAPGKGSCFTLVVPVAVSADTASR